MKLFSGTANKELAQKVALDLGVSLSPLEIFTFPDGERRIQVQDTVVGQDCFVIQPTNPPVDQNYMELFFLIDAAKRSGASSVTAIVPYLGYQRQDHIFRDGEAVSLDVVIKAVEAVGTDQFIGFDLHSIKIPELFHIPVVHLSALPLFAQKIRELDPQLEGVLVTPDMGGIRRIKQVSEDLKGMPYAAVEKNRDLNTGTVASDVIHGEVSGRDAFIVDDMISSGGTIALACNLLKKNGAKDIYVFVTHAVFSEKSPEILQNSLAKQIYVTDTIEVPNKRQFEKLEILSVAPLLAKEIQQLASSHQHLV